jgi:hypothetical protein
MEEILIQIYEWFFGNPYGVTMAIAPAVGAALIGGAVSLIGGLFGGGAAKRRQRKAMAEKRRLEGKLDSLEKSRQANLGVATQAAEMQIEEADIALANTLDTLRATGASAGGATALAQAALQSKKGVSANIEQQEAANEKAKAQGEANLQQLQMAEAQRIQNIGMSEAQRLQQADVSGKSFVYGQREKREGEQLDRVSAQISGAQQQASQAASDRAAISSSMISGLGNIAGSLITSGGLGKTNAGGGAITPNTSPATPSQNYGYNYKPNDAFSVLQNAFNSPASYESPK